MVPTSRKYVLPCALLLIIGLSSCDKGPTGTAPTNEPVYWVDGARPTRPSVPGPIPESMVEELCVPYSADRPDLEICGDGVPPDWTPAPEPYFNDDICAAALEWVEKNEPHAEVDFAGCLVAESNAGSTWDVIMPRTGGAGNLHVPYDPSGEISWAAHP